MRQIGRYRLDHTIGSGAFATVWKGYDPELDTTVAVKVLADNWVLHADVRERFLTEARLLRRIEDRRVIRVHDVGVDDLRPYFVMDYVNGGTLADHVGSLAPQEALRLAAEAAEAVQVLHDAGFVHRDIKPSNLLLDQTSSTARVVVADLGSAKRLADATGYTVTTGTPAYMAPEQADGARGIDGRADVYSLAVVTWELLAGNRPAPVPGAPVGRRTGRGAGLRTPVTIAGVDQRVIDLLLAALDPEPAGRPADARTFATGLVGASSTTDDSASRDDSAGRYESADPRTGRVRPVTWATPLVWLIALIVFGVAVLAGWLLL